MINFYIDSVDRSVVEPLLATGLFAGVTCNPTLLETAGIANDRIENVVEWATGAGASTVFLQAWGPYTDALVRCGQMLARYGENVVVKVPATAEGLAATVRLRADGIRVLVTAVYSSCQLLPALAAGADYIAPYLGRMNDAGRDGPGEIGAMQEIIDRSGSQLKILVASLRSPDDASGLAQLGVSEFTFAPRIWEQFFQDSLTAAAVKEFERASAAG